MAAKDYFNLYSLNDPKIQSFLDQNDDGPEKLNKDHYTKDYKEQVTNMRIKKMTNKQIQDNKFYIGSNSVFTRENNKGWGHKTIDGAIIHARSMIQLEGKDEVFIVKIVKVVTREKAPVKVVDVK